MRRYLVTVIGAVIALVVSLVVIGSGSAQAASPSADGTLSITSGTPSVGGAITFHYSTGTVNSLNWIGIYNDPTTGPINQVYSGHGSTTFQYVGSNASGEVTFTASQLSGVTAGTKIAYFLYDDGYQWLARPLAFTVTPANAPKTDGTLSLTNTAPVVGDDLTFAFGTQSGEVDPKNWVGVYDNPADGPINQTVVGGSTVWSYVTTQSGTVTLDTAGMTPGAKVAYFLAKDEYGWLATPVSFFLAAASAPTGPSADGTLTLTSTGRNVGDDLTFHWATSTPNSLNWIGLYNNPADGPTDQKPHNASTTWSYVPASTSGDLTLSSGALSAGTHTAYFLYNDGYTWLAQPVTFTLVVPPPPVPPHFLTDDFSAGYVHTNTAVSQKLAPLWRDPSATSTTYSKVSGDTWLTVSADGTVSGTAPATAPAHPALITVQAKDDAGQTADVTVEYSVYSTANPPQLKTASWNFWDAGTHVDGALDKEAYIALTQGLDVIGVQESAGTAAKALADELGWYSYQSSGDLGLVSRYPISSPVAPTPGTPAAGATITVGGQAIRVWTAHLDEAAYGPTAVCAGTSAAAEVAAEKATVRYAQAQAVATAIAPDIAAARTTPVVLLGDLASPSQLDWTAATSASHCNAGALDWPVTEAFAHAGLTDSYRAANPNPATSPGNTWSPLAASGSESDRIDYVDYTGKTLSVLESHALVTGFPSATNPAGNSWTSDHAAAVTTFSIKK